MKYFFLIIPNALLQDAEDDKVHFNLDEGEDFHPTLLWPWLDPFWGFVDEIWDGFETRDLSSHAAETLVRAPDDLPSILQKSAGLIRIECPRGRIFIDHRGCLHHVTATKKTPLDGGFAHDAFACGLPRVEDLDEYLTEQAVNYVEDRITQTLLRLEQDPDPGVVYSAILKSLSRIDLAEAEYADIENCVDLSLKLLTQA